MFEETLSEQEIAIKISPPFRLNLEELFKSGEGCGCESSVLGSLFLSVSLSFLVLST